MRRSAVGWHTIAVVEELEAFHDRHKDVELHEHCHELHLEHKCEMTLVFWEGVIGGSASEGHQRVRMMEECVRKCGWKELDQ